MRTIHTILSAAVLTLALGLGTATRASADGELSTALDAVPPAPEAVAPASSMAQGYGLFVFAGGGADALVQAAGCPAETHPQFWTVDAAGEFVGYDPAAPDAATNATWNAAYPDGIVPAGSALLGRCS